MDLGSMVAERRCRAVGMLVFVMYAPLSASEIVRAGWVFFFSLVMFFSWVAVL